MELHHRCYIAWTLVDIFLYVFLVADIGLTGLEGPGVDRPRPQNPTENFRKI